MRLWIDTEFNGYRGPLISMALIDENGLQWYESLGCSQPVPWVAEHVMPVLGIPKTTARLMQESLARFLRVYPSVHLIADWPADIELFCAFIMTGPGRALELPPLTMEIVRGLDARSIKPHNALADAQALRAAYLARLCGVLRVVDRSVIGKDDQGRATIYAVSAEDERLCDDCTHKERPVDDIPCGTCRVGEDGNLTNWEARTS